MRKKSFVFLLLFFLIPGHLQADERIDLGTLYKVSLVRAAPGQLESLIEFFINEKNNGFYAAIGENTPMIMRHSQGDHWDLFLLQEIGSYDAYFSPDQLNLRREKAAEISKYQATFNALAVFREEMFVWGPNGKLVAEAYAKNSFFHFELFAALAGEHAGLLDERIRENRYLEAIGLSGNLIFVTDFGSDIDVFTIGFYESLLAFAEPSKATPEEKRQAAINNGFKSQNHIGFNLRQFLSYHHDTLATKVE